MQRLEDAENDASSSGIFQIDNAMKPFRNRSEIPDGCFFMPSRPVPLFVIIGDCVKRSFGFSLPLYVHDFWRGFGGSVLPCLIMTTKRLPGEEIAPFLRLWIHHFTR